MKAFLPRRLKGISFAVGGAVLWGMCGIAGQYLLSDRGISAAWLTSTRLLLAGVLLLAAAASWQHCNPFALWRDPGTPLRLMVFSMLGTLGTQYCYFASIKASNAPTATILEFMSPLVIIAWFCLRERRLPRRREGVAVSGAFLGMLLLVTRGTWGTLAISGEALFWGLGAAAASALYTIQPRRMLTAYGTPLIAGWGMVVSGVFFLPLARPWQETVPGDLFFWSAYGFIILFGTVLSFCLYLGSTAYIEPAETSVLGAVEPVVSVILAVLLFDVAMNGFELGGMLLILVAVLVVLRG